MFHDRTTASRPNSVAKVGTALVAINAVMAKRIVAKTAPMNWTVAR